MKRKPHLEVCESPCVRHNAAGRLMSTWWIRLVGSNGERMLHSETYLSLSNARRAAKRLAALTGWKIIDKTKRGKRSV